jgi:hypothetical protein
MTPLCHLTNKKSSNQLPKHFKDILAASAFFQSPGNYLGFRKLTESDNQPEINVVLPLSKLRLSFVKSTSEQNNQERTGKEKKSHIS